MEKNNTDEQTRLVRVKVVTFNHLKMESSDTDAKLPKYGV